MHVLTSLTTCPLHAFSELIALVQDPWVYQTLVFESHLGVGWGGSCISILCPQRELGLEFQMVFFHVSKLCIHQCSPSVADCSDSSGLTAFGDSLDTLAWVHCVIKESLLGFLKGFLAKIYIYGLITVSLVRDYFLPPLWFFVDVSPLRKRPNTI